ncbi:unnamed protein product [Aphanomyces euteiches]|uniref:RxLR effector protein n=1 Tax=Aphanomyces euteiches TaxID=100861 RepID=A0A6G0WRP9_9STRA|nr:hypothetical protein Ae201684_012388 [Aphanomyces euteiches]KAH9090602.1 hypothetical protein Ae201684P_014399 [Aphanomyces euteiches]KAH9118559.1 hypothetical protein LEN26_012039 [Aphanomyces euteiches]KAH9150797.1 hypothetical protein AeRB84_006428 [Aphanomyces euteiches]
MFRPALLLVVALAVQVAAQPGSRRSRGGVNPDYFPSHNLHVPANTRYATSQAGFFTGVDTNRGRRPAKKQFFALASRGISAAVRAGKAIGGAIHQHRNNKKL